MGQKIALLFNVCPTCPIVLKYYGLGKRSETYTFFPKFLHRVKSGRHSMIVSSNAELSGLHQLKTPGRIELGGLWRPPVQLPCMYVRNHDCSR